MLDRFDVQAKHVMSAARQIALALRNACIDTEHMLLAALTVPELCALLERAGTTPAAVEKAVMERVRRGTEEVADAVLTVGPCAKGALLRAMEDAAARLDPDVGGPHLLRGLALEREGIAGEALRELGVGAEQLGAAAARSAEVLERLLARLESTLPALVGAVREAEVESRAARIANLQQFLREIADSLEEHRGA